MAKKDKKLKEAKKARTAEKQKKNASKSEEKSKKMAKKRGDEEEDEDIDAILEQFAKEQEELTAVAVEVCERPSKRLNPSLNASPIAGKRELLLFGGEVSDGSVSKFYNDLYAYSIDNNIWRKYVSKNSPLPRSSHAACAHSSGIVLMFGGEFSSPKQSTFYHYGDTWVLDAETKEWEKIETKRGPSARSGHRLCAWKNYIILHGGFRDTGVTTTYLQDMWLFDITTYKWQQVEFPTTHSIPDARSGHSLIPHADGAVLFGGYCKTKLKKGLQKGKVLTDTWLIKMKADPKAIRFERRRKQGFQPSPRVGCSMVSHKNRGILFGGVYDYEESTDNIDSQFYNTLQSYQTETNRWYALNLKPRKKSKLKQDLKEKNRDDELEDILNSILAKAKLNDDDDEKDDGTELSQIELLRQMEEREELENDKAEFPIVNQMPHARFNATTCVVEDTLYIFGGIFERDEQEFNLDSLYAIDLNKLDGVKVLWEDLSELDKAVENSDDDDEDDDDDDEDDNNDDEDEDEKENDDEEVEDDESEESEDDAEDAIPDPRPWLPEPKPFENLRAFYIRTGPQFLEWSISSNRDARGKYLKKAAFDLCEDRFWERREQVRIAEDQLESLGGVGEVVEKDLTKTGKRR